MWGHGGGHPNWHPDGAHLIRNLPLDGKMNRFCKIPFDGGAITVLSEKIEGGGHPTIEPNERYIITDTFFFDTEQKLSIRLIDLSAQEEQTVCVLPTVNRRTLKDPVLRLDGHPAWSRDYRKIVFQAAPEGRRQLFLADLATVI